MVDQPENNAKNFATAETEPSEKFQPMEFGGAEFKKKETCLE